MKHFGRLTHLLALGIIAFAGAGAHARAAALEVGSPEPTWATEDLSGHSLAAADFKGKVVVVDFWATWCAPCAVELPGYIALQKKYAGQGLVIVGFSLDEGGPAMVKKFVSDHGLNYRIGFATDGILKAFGGSIDVIPTTYVFGRDGKLAFKKVGAMPPEQFEAIVKPLLAK